MTPVGSNDPNLKVNQIIDTQMRWWNVPLLETIFSPLDVNAITQIPLHGLNRSDILMWHPTPHGCFTVKSAYRVAKEICLIPSHQLSSSHWSNLWKLVLPAKVKYFAWRLCHDGLATKENLARRGMPINSSCQLCGSAVESALHLFRDCQALRPIWSQCYFMNLALSMSVSSIKTWIFNLLEALDPGIVVKILGLLYHIWYFRNNIVFRGASWHPYQVVCMASKSHLEFMECQRQNALKLRPSISPSWVPPPAGKIKINVDGSWKARERWAGIGVVCRDSTGRVLLSAYQRTHAAGGPSQIEALAFRYGLLLAHRHNWWNIQLEGDSQALVSDLMSGSITNSYQSVVLEEVLALGEALNCEYLYTPRLNNAVADSLALLGRLACTDSEYLQLDGLPPSATASVCYIG